MNATQGGANLPPGANCAHEHGFSRRINPLVTTGLSHSYHLDESIFIFRGIGSDFSFLFHFSMKIM